MKKINLLNKFSLIDSYWDPKIIGELNNQHVKLVKFKGEFVWHKHENEDELFLVIKGKFDMQFRDHAISLGEYDLIVVPRGVEHCPITKDEVHVLLFEPVTTLNTGDVKSDKTINKPEKI